MDIETARLDDAVEGPVEQTEGAAPLVLAYHMSQWRHRIRKNRGNP